ncbi:hypothetical protein D3C80_2041860 [compost metagenome]
MRQRKCTPSINPPLLHHKDETHEITDSRAAVLALLTLATGIRKGALGFDTDSRRVDHDDGSDPVRYRARGRAD